MNTLYVGIDVSGKSNVAYLMKPDGSKHSILTVDNNRIGAQKLVDRITSVLQTLDDPNVVIGMEATSVYGDNLMYFLRESGSLANFKRKLHKHKRALALTAGKLVRLVYSLLKTNRLYIPSED